MLVTVGRVGRAHGIAGAVSVDVRTDEPERRFAPGTVLVATGPDRPERPLVVSAARPHSGRLLVSFDRVTDRTAAEALRGAVLSAEVDPDERPEDPEEFYDHQLVGLEVRAADGAVAGTVTAVLHLPVQDTLTIQDGDGREILVPFVRDLVPHVDVAAGHLVVADRPGLLDPGSDADAEPLRA